METENKGKPLGVFCYEFLGTAFIMYCLMMFKGVYGLEVQIVTFGCMLQAWTVSGGHFNPALTMGMFIAEKKAKNIVVMATMIVAQFAGAFFGILLGYLSLIDVNYQDGQMAKGVSADSKVPYVLIGKVLPKLPSGDYDFGNGDDGWTRDWQTFWSLLITSIFLVVCFISIKNERTQLTDNKLFQALAITLLMGAVAGINSLFGSVGFNPALALAYIVFEETTILNEPNLSTWQLRICGISSITGDCDADHPTYLNHYLWAYLIAPFVGGLIGGIFFHIHAKCTEKKGQDNDKDELLDMDDPTSD